MALPPIPVMMPLEEEATVFAFPIPSGFRAPEETPDGEVFDATVKVRIQDGKVVIDSINGSTLGEVADDTMENEEEGMDDESLEEAEMDQEYA